METRIAIFASGSGSNAENIIKYFAGDKRFAFPFVFSNREDALVHQRAEKLGVFSFSLDMKNKLDWDVLRELLIAHHIDHIVLAGFLLKIPPKILDLYPPQSIINIHPALLPKFGGKGMYGNRVHQAVRAAGETESGITIHYVNENYDEGDIIFQAKCPVLPEDTPETIAQKVHLLEYEWFPKIIEQLWGC